VSYTLRIDTGLTETIASWPIPVAVVREFYLCAVDDLESPTAASRLKSPAADDRLGHLKHVILVDDFSHPGRHYEFFLSIDIRESEIWIVQCDCWLVDKAGQILWSNDVG
jgi:hypothetical protein